MADLWRTQSLDRTPPPRSGIAASNHNRMGKGIASMTSSDNDDARRRLDLERTTLMEVIELHPERLTIDELIIRTATDPDDFKKADPIRQAIRDLRRSGLVRYRNDDELVEPTHAALAAYELLTAS